MFALTLIHLTMRDLFLLYIISFDSKSFSTPTFFKITLAENEDFNWTDTTHMPTDNNNNNKKKNPETSPGDLMVWFGFFV